MAVPDFPLRITSRISVSERSLSASGRVKSVGGGFIPNEAGPFPSPTSPWQDQHDVM